MLLLLKLVFDDSLSMRLVHVKERRMDEKGKKTLPSLRFS